jgi:hypothetical protein
VQHVDDVVACRQFRAYDGLHGGRIANNDFDGTALLRNGAAVAAGDEEKDVAWADRWRGFDVVAKRLLNLEPVVDNHEGEVV